MASRFWFPGDGNLFLPHHPVFRTSGGSAATTIIAHLVDLSGVRVG